MKALEIGAVPNGFRSSLHDWALNERTHRAKSAILPWHVSGDRVEAPRTGVAIWVERRHVLMQQ